jgi:hypothetical protein
MSTARGWSQNKQSRTVGSALARVLRGLARGARQDVRQVYLQPVRLGSLTVKEQWGLLTPILLSSNFRCPRPSLLGSIQNSSPILIFWFSDLSEIGLISGPKNHVLILLICFVYMKQEITFGVHWCWRFKMIVTLLPILDHWSPLESIWVEDSIWYLVDSIGSDQIKSNH